MAEGKIDSSVSSCQFTIEGFSVSFRFDRNRFGRGVIVYVRDSVNSLLSTNLLMI